MTGSSDYVVCFLFNCSRRLGGLNTQHLSFCAVNGILESAAVSGWSTVVQVVYFGVLDVEV